MPLVGRLPSDAQRRIAYDENTYWSWRRPSDQAVALPFEGIPALSYGNIMDEVSGHHPERTRWIINLRMTLRSLNSGVQRAFGPSRSGESPTGSAGRERARLPDRSRGWGLKGQSCSGT